MFSEIFSTQVMSLLFSNYYEGGRKQTCEIVGALVVSYIV